MDQSRGCMFIWSMWYLKVKRLNINMQVFTFIEKNVAASITHQDTLEFVIPPMPVIGWN